MEGSSQRDISTHAVALATCSPANSPRYPTVVVDSTLATRNDPAQLREPPRRTSPSNRP